MRIKQIAAFIMSGVIFTSVPGSLYVNAEDKASDAYYDNIKLYDCALSSEAITGIRIEPRPVEDADNPRLLFAMNFNNRDLSAIAGKADVSDKYKFKVMLWKKDGLEPAMNAAVCE